MADSLESDVLQRGRTFRVRFSLLALMLFITAVSLGLAWFVQPTRVVATAMFQVSSGVWDGCGSYSERPLNRDEFELLKKTQVARLRSDYVLTAALRNPSVAGIGLLANRPDPIEWIRQHLEINCPDNSEILSIQLHGTKTQSADLITLLNAVVQAYQVEVIGEMRQRRTGRRDLLQRNLNDLYAEIRKKSDSLLKSDDEDSPRTQSTSASHEVSLRRLDRIENEILRLESEKVTLPKEIDAERTKRIDQRLAQLREQQAAAEKGIESADTAAERKAIGRPEIEQLQRIAAEMEAKSLQLVIEASSPDQILLIQKPVVSQE